MTLLEKIIRLVDRDVAANSKPISSIGMVIPFVPFMIWVDGAPVDSYPVLSAVALATSIAWGLFVMWRIMLHFKIQLAPHRQTLGSRKFWLLIIGTVFFIVLSAAGAIWLSGQIGWPEDYGFYCHGRCLFEDLANSPKLLSGGSPLELALFVLIWALPTFLVGVLIYALVKRYTRGDPITPAD